MEKKRLSESGSLCKLMDANQFLNMTISDLDYFNKSATTQTSRNIAYIKDQIGSGAESAATPAKKRGLGPANCSLVLFSCFNVGNQCNYHKKVACCLLQGPLKLSF
jgi:hypothetical protein